MENKFPGSLEVPGPLTLGTFQLRKPSPKNLPNPKWKEVPGQTLGLVKALGKIPPNFFQGLIKEEGCLSDIHIETLEKKVEVRLRIDGALKKHL